MTMLRRSPPNPSMLWRINCAREVSAESHMAAIAKEGTKRFGTRDDAEGLVPGRLLLSTTSSSTTRRARSRWPRQVSVKGGKMEATATMLRLEAAVWGRARVEQVAAVSRPVGTFENYMSGMMTSPVVGAIGGNILKRFGVEIDYANGAVYLQKSGATEAHDTDTVGLTLQANADGVVTIAAVSPAAAPAHRRAACRRSASPNRRPRRRRADTLGAAARAAQGTPGDTKTLVIERAGQRLTVKAVVARVL